jgi:hypothetical protein
VRFWDSSAVVPLVVRQPGSDEAASWARQDRRLVVWTLTAVEVLSAIRRLLREEALSEQGAVEAEDVAAVIFGRAHVIRDIDRVKEGARRLLRLHPLRAADALQLAAALAWAEDRPEGSTVHTFDGRLATAARREGFSVIPAEITET